MKRIGLFCILSVGLTWMVGFGMVQGGDQSALNQLLVILMMVLPALSALLTRIFTMEGFEDLYLMPAHGKADIPYFLLAWFGPVLATIIGAVIYFLIHPSSFDPAMNFYTQEYIKQYEAIGQSYNEAQIRQALYSQLVISVLLSPWLNLFMALGNEFGWRGYLLPKLLEHTNAVTAVIMSGLLWAMWYAPFIVMGENYGLDYAGYPYAGVLAMVFVCIVLSAIFTWLTQKTKSCLPSALAYAVFNSFSINSILFCNSADYSPFIGPSPTGIIGGLGFIAFAVYCMADLHKMEKNIDN